MEAVLNASGEAEYRCFIAMRYWHPFAAAAAAAVQAWGAEEQVLLPLYPQFSTTTSGSSIADWQAACHAAGLEQTRTALCCWHSDSAFAAATARLVHTAYTEARASLPAETPLRVLFSAHGLPESIIKRGDPDQWQVEQTVAAVLAALDLPGLDHAICYQSRATPQKWIDPSTESEITRASADKVALLVCPIAFVSDHSETLVELDVEYRELAEHQGVPGYFRVPAQNSDPAFIAALAGLVQRARQGSRRLCSHAGGRQCPKAFTGCPHAKAA